MVDYTGKQDRGIRPGAESVEMTPETFVRCLHVNGGMVSLGETASKHYYQPVCAPQGEFLAGCPHQKACLALRLRMQQQYAIAGSPNDHQPSLGALGAALVEAAFNGLPTGNQQLQGGRNNHGEEKW